MYKKSKKNKDKSKSGGDKEGEMSSSKERIAESGAVSEKTKKKTPFWFRLFGRPQQKPASASPCEEGQQHVEGIEKKVEIEGEEKQVEIEEKEEGVEGAEQNEEVENQEKKAEGEGEEKEVEIEEKEKEVEIEEKEEDIEGAEQNEEVENLEKKAEGEGEEKQVEVEEKEQNEEGEEKEKEAEAEGEEKEVEIEEKEKEVEIEEKEEEVEIEEKEEDVEDAEQNEEVENQEKKAEVEGEEKEVEIEEKEKEVEIEEKEEDVEGAEQNEEVENQEKKAEVEEKEPEEDLQKKEEKKKPKKPKTKFCRILCRLFPCFKKPKDEPTIELTIEPPVQVQEKAPVHDQEEAPVQHQEEAPVQVQVEAPVQIQEEAPVQDPVEPPVQIQEEAPVEPPVQAQEEASVQDPVEPPVQIQEEASVQDPVEPPVQIQEEAPVQDPVEPPVQAQEEASVQDSVEPPVQIQEEAPVEPPVQDQVEAPVEPIIRPNTVQEQVQTCRLGFPNPGQLCYMNSSLQSLLTLTHFIQDINSQEVSEGLNPGAELLSCFMNIRRCRSSKDTKSKLRATLALKRLISRKAPEFIDDDQKDAHEFVTTVIDQIRNLSQPLKKYADFNGSKYKCPVETNIEFLMENTRTCKSCSSGSMREESFTSLSLDVVKNLSVQDMLHNYQKEEDLEYSCDCGGNTSSQKCAFQTLPNILILHLKRFRYTPTFRLVKVHDPVRLCRNLTLSTNQTETSYSLVSVISHIGKGTNSGHYICDGVYSADQWLNYNDSRVQKTSSATVCDARRKTAYILFYQKL